MANPVIPIIISEIQVISPTSWFIELDLREYRNIKSATIKTNRYNKNFTVNFEESNGFAVITSDSIKDTIIEIKIGDTISISLPMNQNFRDEIVISQIGALSSACACEHNRFVTVDNPTIGSANIFPKKTVTVYVLSKVDSLPVQGLGLYVIDMERYVTPHLEKELPAGPFDVNPEPCEEVYYYIMDKLNNYGVLSYNFYDELPDTDTVYIYPTNIQDIKNKEKQKKFSALSVVNTSKSMLFIIKENQNLSGAAQLRITTATGALVKEIKVNLSGSGTYSVNWNRTDSRGKVLSDGIYFAALTADEKKVTTKFTICNNLSGSK